jgi:hypothetical protein
MRRIADTSGHPADIEITQYHCARPLTKREDLQREGGFGRLSGSKPGS